jgi:chromosome partitioning protein
MIIAPSRNNLKQIVILNPKGGCGKTTLATNLACHLALRGSRPLLIDNDPKGYTTRWLETRPHDSLPVAGMTCNSSSEVVERLAPRIPRHVDTIIVDTPAALGEREIKQLTHNANCILVPVLPSAFDVHSSTRFVAKLLVMTDFERPVAVIANRTRQNTRSLDMLLRVLTSFDTPTIAVLRDSQNYVHAANAGLGVCELPYSRVKKDLQQFAPIIDWLDRQMTTRWKSRFLAAIRHR